MHEIELMGSNINLLLPHLHPTQQQKKKKKKSTYVFSFLFSVTEGEKGAQLLEKKNDEYYGL